VDEVPRRRTGRPPLDPNDPSVEMTLSLPSKQYDRLYALARSQRVTVPELVRRVITWRLKGGKAPE
jgi:hypothetical protein